MNIINTAASLLAVGDSAIVILTRGDLLTINPDGTGTSGNWKFSPRRNRNVNKVIIYFEHGSGRSTDVFVANFVGVRPPLANGNYTGPNRHVIIMTNVQQVGITRQMWKVFANAGSNPVRFL